MLAVFIIIITIVMTLVLFLLLLVWEIDPAYICLPRPAALSEHEGENQAERLFRLQDLKLPFTENVNTGEDWEMQNKCRGNSYLLLVFSYSSSVDSLFSFFFWRGEEFHLKLPKNAMPFISHFLSLFYSISPLIKR